MRRGIERRSGVEAGRAVGAGGFCRSKNPQTGASPAARRARPMDGPSDMPGPHSQSMPLKESNSPLLWVGWSSPVRQSPEAR